MGLSVGAEGIEVDGRPVADADVLGFHEHFDEWRGTTWLEVAGPGLRVPIEPGYGGVRAALRQRFPKLPFTADWTDAGGFSGLVLGGAPTPWLMTVLALACVASALAGAVLGAGAGVGVALGLFWPVARLHTRLLVSTTGVQVGPVWSPWVGWNEVKEVRWEARGHRGTLYVVHTDGVGRVELASALLPAVRSRVKRLGALRVTEAGPDTDLHYTAWRPVAVGLPWGLLGATLVLAPWTSEPWRTLAIGLVLAAAGGLVGAAVEARADGWRTGGVFWMTAAWALVLGALALFAV